MTEIFLLRAACLRKRLLPFMLTLAAGSLLAGVAGRVPSRLSRQIALTEADGQRGHSKTWLVVTKLPGRINPPLVAGGGREGSVRMRVVFGEGGFVRNVQTESVVLRGATDEDASSLAREASDAAGRIRFRPATMDGRPVALGATVEYNCSPYYFAHTAFYGCRLSIVEVEDNWRIIYE